MNNEGKIYKTVIFVGYECNNHCRFCMEQDKRNLPVRTTEEVKREIVSALQRGATYLELIGGETTIRPDLPEIIRFAKRKNFQTIMIATNGRMFSYRPVAEKVIKAGLNSIVFSIHGPNAKIHDYLTQAPGSFRQFEKGIKNVREIIRREKIKMHFGSNTTIVRQNYKLLPEIGEYILRQGIRNSEFIFVDCNEGGARRYFDRLVPKISDAAPYINKCLEIGRRENICHWHIRYVPLCYFLGNLDRISELQEVKTFRAEHIAQDFINFNPLESRQKVGRRKALRCRGCALYNSCEGIWVEYLKRLGDIELRPVDRLDREQQKRILSYE